jgi:hypothetical protein
MKCPKCEHVFAPKAISEDKHAAPAKAKSKAKPQKESSKQKDPPKPAAVPAVIADDDDEDSSAYSVVKNEEEDERAVDYGSLRSKFAKSARGPAMAKAVAPSNKLLMEGLIASVGGVGGFMVGIWPFIFSDKAPTFRDQAPIIFGGLVGAAIAFFMCYCVSRFHELTSYALAWTATALGLILALAGAGGLIFYMTRDLEPAIMPIVGLLALGCLYFAYWAVKGMIVLKDPEVQEGFEEVAIDKEGKLLG